MRAELEDAMNIGAVPNVIRREWGIVTTHADIRLYPTSVPGYSEIRWEMDLFQATSLIVGNPVAILHRSKDCGFFYIESPIGKGWVDARDIAVGSREDVRRIVSAKEFLVATTHRVPIYGDPGFSNFSQYFYFAATVPLESKTANAYVISLPYRKHDGTLGTGRAYVRPDADVHVGWLPYTKRNVITQLFNLLGQPYGWHSQQNKRDCAGTQRLLLRSFGIVTGRHTSYILNASDHMFYMNPKLTTEEKIAELDKLEPVVTMTGNAGHIVLYLGKARNGKHYFMHQGGWGIKDADGTEYVVNRTALNDVENSWYSVNRPNVYTTMRP